MPPTVIAASFPITCAQTIVNALHCGLLPGIIDEPGSFSGMCISPIQIVDLRLTFEYHLLFCSRTPLFMSPWIPQWHREQQAPQIY
jgi:hypothetical protein